MVVQKATLSRHPLPGGCPPRLRGCLFRRGHGSRRGRYHRRETALWAQCWRRIGLDLHALLLLRPRLGSAPMRWTRVLAEVSIAAAMHARSAGSRSCNTDVKSVDAAYPGDGRRVRDDIACCPVPPLAREMPRCFG